MKGERQFTNLFNLDQTKGVMMFDNRADIYQVPINPYLVQRGYFRDIKLEDIVGLDSLINYDYMGSSEFEFGSLPAALTRMVSNWGSYVVEELALKDLDRQSCYLLCFGKHVEVLKGVLGTLFSKEGRDKFRTKERTEMYEYISGTQGTYSKTDFWWDIDNDWMCCFGLYNLQRLIRAIRYVWVKRKAGKVKDCTTCSHAVLCEKVELKGHKESCIKGGYEYHIITFPDYGPQEIVGSHFRPVSTVIERDRNLLRIKQIDGRDVVVNLRKVQDVDMELDRVTVTVLNRSGQLRRVIIASPDRVGVLYDIFWEWRGINKRI